MTGCTGDQVFDRPTAHRLPPAPTVAAPAANLHCGSLVPADACATAKRLGIRGAVEVCTGDSRSGRWDYALVAPHYTLSQDVAIADVRAMWKGKSKHRLAVHTELAAVWTKRWGAAGPGVITSARPETRRGKPATWALVPAHQLTPHVQPLRVNGTFALDRDDRSPLAINLCAAGGANVSRVRNIVADKTTLLTMTGVTAPTRRTGALMQRKGVRYPARDIAHWFRKSDFVHVSNEVSFRPGCKHRPIEITFCAREDYIGLLEAIGANIIELTGSHLIDHGRKWMRHTLDMYRKRGWRWFGGGYDQTEATRPLTFDHNGNRIAMLGCNQPRTQSNLVRNLPGEAVCDFERMLWQVRRLRAKGFLPVVSIQHWEFNQYEVHRRIVRDLRPFAEAGAVMVLGSQAHQPHPFEVHYGAFVHYGPGNLFFDMMNQFGTRAGITSHLYFHAGKLVSVEQRFSLIQENGRPVPMTVRQRRFLLDVLAQAKTRLWPRAKPHARPRLATTLVGQPRTYVSRDGQDIIPYSVTGTPSQARGLVVRFTGAGRVAPAPKHAVISLRLKRRRRWQPKRIAEFVDHLVAAHAADETVLTVRGHKGSASERFCLGKQGCRFVDEAE